MATQNLYSSVSGEYVGWMDSNSPIVHQHDMANPYEGEVLNFEGKPVGEINSASTLNPIPTSSGGGCFAGISLIGIAIFSMGYTYLFYQMWLELERKRFGRAFLYLLSIEGVIATCYIISGFLPMLQMIGSFLVGGILLVNMLDVAHRHPKPWKPLAFALVSGLILFVMQGINLVFANVFNIITQILS